MLTVYPQILKPVPLPRSFPFAWGKCLGLRWLISHIQCVRKLWKLYHLNVSGKWSLLVYTFSTRLKFMLLAHLCYGSGLLTCLPTFVCLLSHISRSSQRDLVNPKASRFFCCSKPSIVSHPIMSKNLSFICSYVSCIQQHQTEGVPLWTKSFG